MLYDTHTHSLYSEDGADSIQALCEAAVDRGLAGLCITDHVDLCDAPIGYEFYLRAQEGRKRDFARAKSQYAGRLELLWGIELGHPQYLPQVARRILQSDPFDFVLGAVHFLPDGRDLYSINYTGMADVEEVMDIYFAQMLELIRFGGFDSLAHLDYPLRKMQRVLAEATVLPYRPMVEKVLEATVEAGLALELNTAGLSCWKNRVEPEDWVVRRYKELGGQRLTLGSDAHVKEKVGTGLGRAARLARSCGFESATVYRGRRPCAVPLPMDLPGVSPVGTSNGELERS